MGGLRVDGLTPWLLVSLGLWGAVLLHIVSVVCELVDPASFMRFLHARLFVLGSC